LLFVVKKLSFVFFAATAATINFFIIYSICCEKNLSKIAKDGINYTSVYSKVNTSLQKKYKRYSNTSNRKRVNLNVIGKSGSTTVVASFRTDDKDANRSTLYNTIVSILKIRITLD
jgi:hypothetical protein